ncbi:MAG: helix-turn-helix transcriptional regulator [Ruminococcaceae bacterium]|nr:helix-turn-helix transcriptional regulator [Oscillospiraceae bacterium]
MTVSERIRTQMKLLDLSYGELSAATGLTKSAIHRYATGQTDKIPTEALEKLARALGVTPAYLTGWEQERPHTLAAHFEGEEFSDEELREIEDFVRFVKSKRIGKRE